MTKLKITAGLAFFLNTMCFATYYAVAKEALGRIDPIIFTYFELMALAPVSLVILLCSWRHITRAVVRRGMLLGSTLCLALFTIAIALNYTTATSVAFFPAMNGFLAAVFAWLVLRQPVSKTTWLAGLLSLTGVAMLIINSSMGGWRGSVIAFLGGLFFTGYIFVSDMDAKQAEQEGQKHTHWPLFGIELLTMAVWANLVMLLFGNWHTIHPSLPKDIIVVAYVAGVCTFLPTLITVLMQRYISPVTVSFIYILEPVLGAVVSALYLGESLPLAGYAGGLLVVLGAIIHTWGSASGRAVQAGENREVEETSIVAEPDFELFEEYDFLPDWGAARSPLQRGMVTYSVARKGEKQLLQQRRQQRVSRLRLVETP